MPSKKARHNHPSPISEKQESRSSSPSGDERTTRTPEEQLECSYLLPQDPVELLSRMRGRTGDMRRAEKDANAREELVKARYAGGSTTKSKGKIGAASTSFDKNALLADMFAETRSNFLKLDQNLSEDYSIATRRLHSAVFSHASDFLQLFRDVYRASTLAESLKSSVQGTKAVISAISKSAACGRSSGTDEGAFSATSSALSPSFIHNSFSARSNSNANSVSSTVTPRLRPSLIAVNLARRQPRRELFGTFAFYSHRGVPNSNSSADSCSGYNAGVNGSRGGRVWSNRGEPPLATTRSLNVTSVHLWQNMILAGGAEPMTSGRRRWYTQEQQDEVDRDEGNVEQSKSQDITVFVEVLRQEVTQAITERRFVETAELLRSSEAEADAKGCLPILLELEEMLAHAIRLHVRALTMPLMYSESIHIPLIQLLLRFGRAQYGLQLFFHLHAVWLDAEMEKLQLRIDSHKGALIASDFLVCAMLEVLEKHKNLWRCAPLGNNTTGGGNGEESAVVPTGSSSKNDENKAITSVLSNRSSSLNHSASSGRPEAVVPKMPPSYTVVLWVHDRLDKFAREVLQPRALSYGIGAEGGDPSRFRRAVLMAADVIRTVRRLDEFGFAGCDTRLLLLLTPSLIYLETDFCRCTDSRLATTGRAMIEHLLYDVRLMYQSQGEMYSVKVCGEVARLNNSACRELQRRLWILPQTSYALLVELLLAPTSSRLFASRGLNGSSVQNGAHASASLLESGQYSFLRHSNGCTRVHGLLLASVLRFIAAMTGCDVLPLELAEQQQQEVLEQLASQAECVSFLLSSPLVIESLDVTLHRLFLSLMHTTLRQRQTLVVFMLSEEFRNMYSRIFDGSSRFSSSAPSLVRNPWVLEAMQLMVADVLSTSVWVAFLSRGGALSQLLLLKSAQAFRVQYVEELRRALPCIVQGWMVATLSLAHDHSSAQDLLIGNAFEMPLNEQGASAVPVTEAGCSHMLDTSDPRGAVVRLLEAAAVNGARLMPFLLSLVQDQFVAITETAEEAAMLCASLPPPPSSLWCLRGRLGNYPCFPIGGKFSRDDELFLFHLFVQIALNVLGFFQEHLLIPSYVVNERWAAAHPEDGGDDSAGRVPERKSGKFPSRGCVAPKAESTTAALSAGGGNYVSAVALLQFIVYRLLKDVLCRPKTWNVVYGLRTRDKQWDEKMVRQQVFFFALFVRFWSPLFVGNERPPPPPHTSTTAGPTSNRQEVSPILILQWMTCSGDHSGQQQELRAEVQNGSCALDLEALAFPSSTVWFTRGANTAEQLAPGGNGEVGSNEECAKDSNTERASVPGLKCSDNNGGSSKLLLSVVDDFFRSHGESRAMPAINSALTKSRVEKVMTSLNLLDIVSRFKSMEEDRESTEDAEEDEEPQDAGERLPDGNDGRTTLTETHTSSKTHAENERCGAESSGESVTLFHLHEMLLHYLFPVM